MNFAVSLKTAKKSICHVCDISCSRFPLSVVDSLDLDLLISVIQGSDKWIANKQNKKTSSNIKKKVYSKLLDKLALLFDGNSSNTVLWFEASLVACGFRFQLFTGNENQFAIHHHKIFDKWNFLRLVLLHVLRSLGRDSWRSELLPRIWCNASSWKMLLYQVETHAFWWYFSRWWLSA